MALSKDLTDSEILDLLRNHEGEINSNYDPALIHALRNHWNAEVGPTLDHPSIWEDQDVVDYFNDLGGVDATPEDADDNWSYHGVKKYFDNGGLFSEDSYSEGWTPEQVESSVGEQLYNYLLDHKDDETTGYEKLLLDNMGIARKFIHLMKDNNIDPNSIKSISRDLTFDDDGNVIFPEKEDVNTEDIGVDFDGDGKEDISTDLDNNGTKDIGLDLDGDGKDDTEPDPEDNDKDDTMKNIISSLSDKKF